MVTGLQNVRTHIRAGFQQVALGLLLHIARKQEARLAVIDAQDKTAVIGIGIFLHRPDDCHRCAAETPVRAGLRHLDLPALLFRILDHVGENLRRILCDTGIDVFRRVFCQHGGQSPAVILVRVRIDHIGQLRHVQPVQTGHQKLPLLDRPAINEHRVLSAGEQDTVSLSDVEKTHRQRLIRRHLLRCGGRF